MFSLTVLISTVFVSTPAESALTELFENVIAEIRILARDAMLLHCIMSNNCV